MNKMRRAVVQNKAGVVAEAQRRRKTANTLPLAPSVMSQARKNYLPSDGAKEFLCHVHLVKESIDRWDVRGHPMLLGKGVCTDGYEICMRSDTADPAKAGLS